MSGRRLFPLERAPVDPAGEFAALQVGDPVERELLAAIATGDEAAHLVYADWLEQRGDAARAEFLRAQSMLARRDVRAMARDAASQRLDQLAPDIELAWRLAVRRGGIGHCAAFGFRCECAWRALTSTAHAEVRHCEACDRRVRCCRSQDEAERFTARGMCVVVHDTGEPPADDAGGLPEQLRYLERLAPSEAPPAVMAPAPRAADLVDYLRELLKL
ncbi:MAG TPA: TIGR02996 domain-containing protein [Kofleriaceae bacterium]|nr:TIGR02996 domain-containing protein [Kofleriaceae bacterium]